MKTNRSHLSYYLLSTFFGLLASNMLVYSSIVYMQALSTQTFYSGITYFVIMGPVLILGLFSGAMADVHCRKRLFFRAQIIITLFVALLCWLIYAELVSSMSFLLWFGILFVYGCVFSFVPTARLALIGDFVSRKQLGTVSILVNVFVLVSYSGAPIIAGYFYETFSWLVVYEFIFGLFLCSNLILIGVPSGSSRPKRMSYILSLRSVFRYMRRNEKLRQLFLLLALIFVCMIGPFQILIPEYAKSVLGLNEMVKGSLLAFLGLGVLVGSISVIFLKRYIRRGLLIVVANVMAGALFMVFSQVTDLRVISVILVLMGFSGGAAYALVPSILQEEVSNQRRGRVMSVYIVFSMGVPAIGGLLGSLFSTFFGVPVAVAVMGGVGVFGILLFAITQRQFLRVE